MYKKHNKNLSVACLAAAASLCLLLLAGHVSARPSKDHLLRNVLHCLQELLLVVLALLRHLLTVVTVRIEI